jgi:hypothetical protein
MRQVVPLMDGKIKNQIVRALLVIGFNRRIRLIHASLEAPLETHLWQTQVGNVG